MGIDKKIILLAFMAVFLLNACATRRAFQTVISGEVAHSVVTETEIDFELEGHLILLDLSLNGVEEATFILDTGAMTVIDSAYATELGLATNDSIRAIDSGGATNTVSLARLRSLRVGDLSIANLGVSIFDLSKINTLSQADIKGILGSNFLRFFKVIIDYQEKKLSLSTDLSIEPISENGYGISFIPQIQAGFAPGLTLSLNNQTEQLAIVDTGAVGMLALSLDTISGLYPEGDPRVIRSVGVLGGGALSMAQDMRMARLETVEIGQLGLSNVPAVSSGIDMALIGKDFLSQFRISLNYPKGWMILEPYADARFRTNFISPGFGVFPNEAGKLIITGYWEQSPADELDIPIGAEVLAINGKGSEDYSAMELTDELYSDTGGEIRLKLLYEGEAFEYEISKRPLLP